MYTIDDLDRVIALEGLPPSNPGSRRTERWPWSRRRPLRRLAHMFGPPNDEAFRGHPLASRGLRPYEAFRVLSSSWLRRLEQMNAVHPQHRADRFRQFEHFVLSFHDSTFECIARSVEAVAGYTRSPLVVQRMATLLK